jgi:transcriptional regulator with XRE-family HTH domain
LYLNGNRLREAARLSNMSKDELQKKSGLEAKNMDYYWNNNVTAPSQGDLDALAKALNVSGDVLIIKGEPEVVALRPDKFVSDEGDIEWK